MNDELTWTNPRTNTTHTAPAWFLKELEAGPGKDIRGRSFIEGLLAQIAEASNAHGPTAMTLGTWLISQLRRNYGYSEDAVAKGIAAYELENPYSVDNP